MSDDGPAQDEGPSSELLAAIEQAARSVGQSPSGAPGARRPTDAAGAEPPPPIRIRFDGARAPRTAALVVALLLAGALAGGSLLALRARADPPPARVAADLRWAVAQVVRRVDALRAQTGRLPEAGDLQGLVSDLVVYERTGDAYRVYGRRGAVRVEFDGSVPLARWLDGRGP